MNPKIIPLSVPESQHATYLKNYKTITKDTHKLFLFAADQKMEHLNADFSGPSLAPEINEPERLFRIATAGDAGAFATHIGMIDRYAPIYSSINYIAKLNGKTNLGLQDPYSKQMWSFSNVLALQKAGISICGVGYTIYPGSEFEKEMLTEAAQLVQEAHTHGMIAILWIYPRGKNVKYEKSPEIIAGAAGLGLSLGADFVKIHAPESGNAHDLIKAVQAAGTTQVIVSGGETIDSSNLLERIKDQLIIAHVAGVAIGRNIFQHPYKEAVDLSKKIAQLVYET